MEMNADRQRVDYFADPFDQTRNMRGIGNANRIGQRNFDRSGIRNPFSDFDYAVFSDLAFKRATKGRAMVACAVKPLALARLIMSTAPLTESALVCP